MTWRQGDTCPSFASARGETLLRRQKALDYPRSSKLVVAYNRRLSPCAAYIFIHIFHHCARLPSGKRHFLKHDDSRGIRFLTLRRESLAARSQCSLGEVPLRRLTCSLILPQRSDVIRHARGLSPYDDMRKYSY